jgi:hypothetical protein
MAQGTNAWWIKDTEFLNKHDKEGVLSVIVKVIKITEKIYGLIQSKLTAKRNH